MSRLILPHLILPALVAAPFLLLSRPAAAQTDGSWKDDIGTNWSVSSAWVSGAVPGGAGSVVSLANNITAPRTITLDTASRTVGTLTMGDADGSDSFTLAASGGASLIFDNGGSAAGLNFSSSGGLNTVSAPISLLSPLTVANGSSGTQTLSGGLSAGSAGTKTLVNSGTGGGGVTISGIISDGSGVVAVTQNSASSSLTLSGINTYSGNTTLGAGRLQIGNNSGSVLGSGTLIITGGSLSSNSAATRTIANTTVLDGNLTVGDVANTGQLTLGGATALTGNRTLTVAAGATAFWSGVITQTGGVYGITKEGDGVLTLSANNDFEGGFTLNAGTLRLGGNRAWGTGALTLNGGALSASSATARGISNLITIGGDLILGDAVNTGALTFSGTTTLTGNRTLTIRSNTTFSGVIRESGGSNGLTKSGDGTLTLSGTSTYTGGTTISGGTFVLGKTEVLADSGAVTVAGGTFDLGGFNEKVGAVNINGGTIAHGTLTGGSYAATSGTVSAVLAGSGVALTKSGPGTVTLSGSSTYTGATSVNAGSLQVAASGGLNATSGIAVQGGARFVYNSATPLTAALSLNGSGTASRAVLSGSGTIQSAVALDNRGDTLSPGNSPGKLQFGVGQSWDAFGYDWEINNFTGTLAGTDFDQISIAGGLSLSLSGDYELNLLSLTAGNESGLVGGFSDTHQTWTILTTTGGILGFDASRWSFNTAGFASGAVNPGLFSMSQSPDGHDLLLSYDAIPEPSSIAFVGAAMGIGALFRRRFRC